MPKLIERLFRRLERSPTSTSGVSKLRRRRRSSKLETLHSLPDWTSPRIQSIILDSANPLIDRYKFRLHKSTPPPVASASNAYPFQTNAADCHRKMTTAERNWWANPYLRMLSSPVRRCIVTMRYLPREFLIRVNPRRIAVPQSASSKHTRYALFPDGLEHPKFRGLHYRRAYYILCRGDVIEQLTSRKHWKGLLPPKTMIHSSLSVQIAHLLRLRVVQELELLANRLQTRAQDAADAPVLRRLTRGEFKELRATGHLPFTGVAAVLVVPPVNRNPTTKTRPLPNLTALPDASLSLPGTPKREVHSVSSLYHVGESSDLGELPLVSSAKVPLYNSAALFPNLPQRVSLHKCLSHILRVERRVRYRELQRNATPRLPASGADCQTTDKDRQASHAFALYSTKDSIRRVDSVPLLTALWRLHMWDGSTYSTSEGTWTSIDIQ